MRTLASRILLAVSLFTAGCAADATDTGEDDPSSSDEALTSANAKTAFHYFTAKGLTGVQAAGIVGNLQQESGINPKSVQPGGPGRGIAQWSVGGRYNHTSHDNLQWYAAQHGGSSSSLSTQLDFIWYELQNFDTYGLAQLRRATTVEAAVRAFQNEYEICGACAAGKRVTYAKQALAAYGN